MRKSPGFPYYTLLMGDREKKRGRRKYKHLNISTTKKALLDGIKNIFHSFGRAIIWLKIKT